MPKSRPFTGHAPMAGRVANRHGSCCGGPPGIDCSDFGKSVKDQRRLEDAWWQRTEVPQPAVLPVPFEDLSDCAHGCNGDCMTSGSDRCNFTCHEHDEAPAVKPGLEVGRLTPGLDLPYVAVGPVNHGPAGEIDPVTADDRTLAAVKVVQLVQHLDQLLQQRRGLACCCSGVIILTSSPP